MGVKDLKKIDKSAAVRMISSMTAHCSFEVFPRSDRTRRNGGVSLKSAFRAECSREQVPALLDDLATDPEGRKLRGVLESIGVTGKPSGCGLSAAFKINATGHPYRPSMALTCGADENRRGQEFPVIPDRHENRLVPDL